MNISISVDKTSADVAISGELNQTVITKNFWTSKKSAELSTVQKITVHMDEIKNADTAGLAWLLNFKRDALKVNKECTFVKVPPKIIELAKLSGADKLLIEGVSNDK
ncbi:MAG: STAS domain-containing protein [Pseudomonadota bacterium]